MDDIDGYETLDVEDQLDASTEAELTADDLELTLDDEGEAG